MGYTLVENPAYAATRPRILVAKCHDQTPFVTVRCDCGQESHIHESALPPIATGKVGMKCSYCQDVLVFPRSIFERAFARMRAEGWIR